MTLNLDRTDTQALADLAGGQFGYGVSVEVNDDGTVTVYGIYTATEVILGATPEPVREMVEKGRVLLNRFFGPNWASLIDPEEVDVNSTTLCPLGQAFGSIAERLGEHTYSTGYDVGTSILCALDANFDISAHGFTSNGQDAEQVNKEWARVIRKAREDKSSAW